MRRLLEKLKLTISEPKIVETSIAGLNISLKENIPLGDGFLIANRFGASHTDYSL